MTIRITRPVDDSQVDPMFRPTKRELKEADKEGDS